MKIKCKCINPICEHMFGKKLNGNAINQEKAPRCPRCKWKASVMNGSGGFVR